jgi:hypothetical protein
LAEPNSSEAGKVSIRSTKSVEKVLLVLYACAQMPTVYFFSVFLFVMRARVEELALNLNLSPVGEILKKLGKIYEKKG